MAGLFSSPSPPPRVVRAEPEPTREDPKVVEARRRRAIADRKSRGRAATLLTGARGADQSASPAVKQLFGE